jgi:hypothetical protein
MYTLVYDYEEWRRHSFDILHVVYMVFLMVKIANFQGPIQTHAEYPAVPVSRKLLFRTPPETPHQINASCLTCRQPIRGVVYPLVLNRQRREAGSYWLSSTRRGSRGAQQFPLYEKIFEIYREIATSTEEKWRHDVFWALRSQRHHEDGVGIGASANILFLLAYFPQLFIKHLRRRHS